MKTNFFILSLLLAPLPGAFAQSKPTADLIITNAKVWIVDKTHPAAQAVAVLGDRIVALGSNADIDAWRSASTRVINAAGKLLLPGFNDAHGHFVSGGFQPDTVQLYHPPTRAAFVRRIGEQAEQTPEGDMVVGRAPDENKRVPARTAPT